MLGPTQYNSSEEAETKGEFTETFTLQNSQCHSLKTWTVLGTSVPGEALSAVNGGSSSLHWTRPAEDRTVSQSKTSAAK